MRVRLAAWAALAFHALGMGVLLRGVRPLAPDPLLTADFSLYYARALRASSFWSESGRLWGYDPFAMAGYPAGAVHEAGSYFFTLFSVLLHPFLGIARPLLLLEILILIAPPFVVWAALRLFEHDRKTALHGFVLTAAAYGTFGFISREAMRYGFLPLQGGMMLALLATGLFHKWMERGARWAGWLFTGTAVVLPLMHPAGAIAALPALAVIYGRKCRHLPARVQAAVVGGAALSFAVTLSWLVPYRAFSDWIVRSGTPDFTAAQLLKLISLTQSSGAAALAACFHFYLLILAARGLWVAFRSKSRSAAPLAVLFFSSLVFALTVPVNGQWRFLLTTEFLLYVLAAVGLESWREALFKGRLPAVALGLASAAAILTWIALIPTDQRRLANVLPPDQQAVVAHVRAESEMPGRVLVNCAWGSEPQYLDLLPILTGAHVLGGSNPYNFLKSRFTIFSGVHWAPEGVIRGTNVTVFGRPLKDMTEDYFATQARRYNVREVITDSPGAARVFATFTRTLSRADNVGAHSVWHVKEPGSWFIEGNGELRASCDKLEVTHASAGRLILSFHWIKTLTTEPPLPIRPVLLPESPVAFIEIDNTAGVPAFTISNGGLSPARSN